MVQSTVASRRPRSDVVRPSRPLGVARDPGCPYWCELPTDHNLGAHHVAHRAAMWELEDRVEIGVIQVLSEDPADRGQVNRQPTLYFWSAEHVALSDAECAEMARALCRAGDLLHRVNGI
jgi:hypothetical protein